MQAAYRLIARLTFLMRFGVCKYREVCKLASTPGRPHPDGLGFWDMRPGLTVRTRHKGAHGLIADTTLNSWPYRRNDMWMISYQLPGFETFYDVFHLADRGVLPSSRGTWGRLNHLVGIGKGKTNPNLKPLRPMTHERM